MIVRRIGNDVRFNWRIRLPSGNYVNFSGTETMQVKLIHNHTGLEYPQEFELKDDDTTIALDFTASEQYKIGVYSLWTSFTRIDPSIEGGIATTTRDKRTALKLVEFDSKETLTDDDNIDIITVIEKGDAGITPHIGANGNWHIGDEDTGMRATGNAVINVVEELPDVGTSGEFYATFED